MNLHHLRIFYTVAQRRSVTAAAADLLLSQPAVSLQLKALEKELGLPLFQRGGSKLRLTQAGEVLYRGRPYRVRQPSRRGRVSAQRLRQVRAGRRRERNRAIHSR